MQPTPGADMEDQTPLKPEFQPEPYCLACHQMEWDEENRCCTNFDTTVCPLGIRRVLECLDVGCMVI